MIKQGAMSKVENVTVDHFRVPLAIPLSDSTHGEITQFGLVTVRLTDGQGREGLGYTYTVNNIGAAAVTALIEQDLAGLILSTSSDRSILARDVVACAFRGPWRTSCVCYGRCRYRFVGPAG